MCWAFPTSPYRLENLKQMTQLLSPSFSRRDNSTSACLSCTGAPDVPFPGSPPSLRTPIPLFRAAPCPSTPMSPLSAWLGRALAQSRCSPRLLQPSCLLVLTPHARAVPMPHVVPQPLDSPQCHSPAWPCPCSQSQPSSAPQSLSRPCCCLRRPGRGFSLFFSLFSLVGALTGRFLVL